MDDFEKRLKEDAEAIQAEISPQLRMRIDASLRGVEHPVSATKKGPGPALLWWASSITGLAAAAAVIALLNFRVVEQESAELVVQAEDPAITVPRIRDDLQRIPSNLALESAEFTGPLQEELAKLQADIEKARLSVQEDVDFTF